MFGNMKFGMLTDYEYAYKFCKKRWFKAINYKIFRLGEDVRLCMTEKFNKSSL
jgi:hypothetical protein